MRKRIFRRKKFVVDGLSYTASLTSIVKTHVDLRLTPQADFGTRSFCIIRGLRNFAYFSNYGFWSADDFSEAEQTVVVTPGMIVALISFAHRSGWSPECSASNHQLEITNLEAKALLESTTE